MFQLRLDDQHQELAEGLSIVRRLLGRDAGRQHRLGAWHLQGRAGGQNRRNDMSSKISDAEKIMYLERLISGCGGMDKEYRQTLKANAARGAAPKEIQEQKKSAELAQLKAEITRLNGQIKFDAEIHAEIEDLLRQAQAEIKRLKAGA